MPRPLLALAALLLLLIVWLALLLLPRIAVPTSFSTDGWLIASAEDPSARDVSTWRIRFFVPESARSLLAVGDTVAIRSDAWSAGEAPLHGVVTVVSERATGASRFGAQVPAIASVSTSPTRDVRELLDSGETLRVEARNDPVSASGLIQTWFDRRGGSP